MSAAEEAGDGLAPPPRETLALFGHEQAESALLDAYRSGRIAHAWLIGGPAGIGKATLAWRMARFVLAHPDPEAPEVRRATSLALPAGHPAVRKTITQGHPDLFVLERVPDDKGKLHTVIRVDETRRLVKFLGSTAREGGWRVVVVDSADELNASSANAVLKLLEEPPARTIFLVVSHAPGRLLPTIRSRCRMLALRPLSEDDVAKAVAAALERKPGDADVRAASAAAEGSVVRAIVLMDEEALKLRQDMVALLERLPQLDYAVLHALGDRMGTAERDNFENAVDAINGWLSMQLREGTADPARLARLATAFEAINRSARDGIVYNVDKKPLMFSIFGTLAEASRG